MTKYKYHLLKYKGKQSRLTCPECGRPHCFTPYVDDNEQIIGEQYGRCDHESSCGYISYPPAPNDWREPYPQRQYRKPQRKPTIIMKPKAKVTPTDQLSTIPMEIVKKTIRKDKPSDFITFLQTLFDQKTIDRLIDEYQIGVTKSNDAVFYQIDQQGRCRTGKVMKYDPITGHRIKGDTDKTPITWVHSLLKQQGVLPDQWELTQCLFGEHLLKRYPDRVVALVESEKTAIICAGIAPDCIWMATGGKGQLNDRVEVLDGRKIVAFPDIDGYDTWSEKIRERPYLSIHLSDILERNATPEDREAHIDIADVLIRWKLGKQSFFSSEETPSNTDVPFPDNPIMQEIMKCISPQYWDEIDDLIKELDLELIGMTRSIETIKN